MVEIRPVGANTISKSTGAIWFDAASGELLATSPTTVTRRAYDFLYGIHLIQFDHWTLRWLYFLSGLAGSVLIATGLLFWVQSRRKRYEKTGGRGVRLAEAGIDRRDDGIADRNTGIPHRQSPSTAFGSQSCRGGNLGVSHCLDIRPQFTLSFAVALLGPNRRGLIAGGCALATLLNAVTTHDILPITIMRGQWPVAGVDLFLLGSGAIAAGAAFKLGRLKPAAQPRSQWSDEAMTAVLLLLTTFAIAALGFAMAALSQKQHWQLLHSAVAAPEPPRWFRAVDGF